MDLLIERLAADKQSPAVESVVLAALGSDAELQEALGTPATEAPRRPEKKATNETPETATPAAYLERLDVTGFRGIGPTATLRVQPGPGLTVVCGRNGSGKSSFAEALEVLMTGGLKRWASRSADWKDTWRCLHSPTTEIRAELLVEGVNGVTTLRRAWTPEQAKLGDAATSLQPLGQPKAGLDLFGWDRAVSEHRPFLSHAELEALLDQPKALHDQLNDLLGLEELDAAGRRLRTARTDLDKESKAAKAALPELRAALAGSDDERAERARMLLGAKAADLDALEALATGAGTVDAGPIELLARLATIEVPSKEEVEKAGSELLDAEAASTAAASEGAAGAVESSTLLEVALAHTETHPGDRCPMCGTPGVIDDEWRARTADTLVRLREEGEALRSARERLDAALDAARRLIRPAPEALSRAGEVGVDAVGLVDAWGLWSSVPDRAGAGALADHFRDVRPLLADTLRELRGAVAAQQQSRQDLWAPLAKRVLEWCEGSRVAASAAVQLKLAKTAETWLRGANQDVRNDRLLPLATRIKELWDELRHASNVDLLEVRLTGSGNQAKVDFRVKVDGTDATGLGVMSQGEANALALSVFLPRATMPGSPFGFLVIDDPVQAMDPSKVDGLARVLADAGKARQVIVFTHDDRLPDAVRRLGLPGRVLRVSRKTESQVQVDPAGDPFDQLLGDATQLVKSDNIPAEAAAKVVSGICRTALEIALNDITRRRLLAKGTTHADVEDALAGAHRLWERLSLAAYGTVEADDKVRGWLGQKAGTDGVNLVYRLNRASHGAGDGAVTDLPRDTRALVRKLREALT